MGFFDFLKKKNDVVNEEFDEKDYIAWISKKATAISERNKNIEFVEIYARVEELVQLVDELCSSQNVPFSYKQFPLPDDFIVSWCVGEDEFREGFKISILGYNEQIKTL